MYNDKGWSYFVPILAMTLQILIIAISHFTDPSRLSKTMSQLYITIGLCLFFVVIMICGFNLVIDKMTQLKSGCINSESLGDWDIQAKRQVLDMLSQRVILYEKAQNKVWLNKMIKNEL